MTRTELMQPMDEVAIRLATADDLDALVELATAFRDHLRQATPTARQLHDGFALLLGDSQTDFLLARRPDGVPLGYVQIRYRLSAWVGGVFAELEDVFVHPEALALYGAAGFAAERARWQGGRQLWLERVLDDR